MFRRFWRRLKYWFYEWWNGRLAQLGICPSCREYKLLHYQSSMTMYPKDSDNFNGHLCRVCQDEYVSYWQERWDEYNSSRF